MRIRTIKPEFYRHEGIAELPFETRILFIALWGLCDSQGRFEWRPKRIKIEVFPYDTEGSNGEAMDVSQLLHQLQRREFLFQYSVEGKDFGFIPSFREHQRLSGKEAQCSGIHPAPSDSISEIEPLGPSEEMGKQSGSNGESQEQGTGKGTGNKERNRVPPESPKGELSKAHKIEKIYESYPRKQGKAAAIKSIEKQLKSHEFEHLLAQTQAFALARKGQDPQFTPNPSTWFNQGRFDDDPETWPDRDSGSASRGNLHHRTTGLANKGRYFGGGTTSPTSQGEKGSQGSSEGESLKF